jgi:hypothetical protein
MKMSAVLASGMTIEYKRAQKERVLASTWLSISSFSTPSHICDFSELERVNVCLGEKNRFNFFFGKNLQRKSFEVLYKNHTCT